MSVIQIARNGLRIGSRTASRAGSVDAALTGSAWLVLGVSGILLAAGLVMILSSSSVSAFQAYGSSFFFVKRQVLWAIVGVGIAIALARTDYRKLRGAGWILLLLSVVGLVAVLIPGIGIRVSGSSRWLGVGWLRIQPSEFAKLALLLVAADVIVRKQGRLGTLTDIFKPLGAIVLLVAGLVMLQPDLGTTLVLTTIVFIVLYVGSVPMRHVSLIAAGGMAAASVLAFSAGYRKDRIMSFLDPFADKLGSGYQAVQSLIAIGSGGLFGVGLGEGRQKWSYVPNAHTDFIFAIIGEELGLMGTLPILALFLVLAYAGVRVARRAPDLFGRVVAAGITAWICGQAILNMGAVTGLLPITGVPLPLVSFGGSALVFTLAGVGILVSIARHEKAPAKAAAPGA